MCVPLLTCVTDRPISLGYTKLLATQSVRAFLEIALTEGSRRASNDSQRPGISVSPPSPARASCFISHPKPPLPSRPRERRAGDSPQLAGLEAPPRHESSSRAGATKSRSYSTSYPDERAVLRDIPPQISMPLIKAQPPSPPAEPKRPFKRLEDYIINCVTSFHALNSSFASYRPSHHARPSADSGRRRPAEPRKEPNSTDYAIADLDPKLLLLGDFAENGSWWTGGQEDAAPGRTASTKSEGGQSSVSPRSPRIDWAAVDEWYAVIVDVARPWPGIYEELVAKDPSLAASAATLADVDMQLLMAQDRIQRTLLKASETILKRPGRVITSPHELRFLLILSANPLLHVSYKPYKGEFEHSELALSGLSIGNPRGTAPASGRHSALIKRIVGLMSNTPSECHNHLVAWFARYPEALFIKTKDLISEFLAFRLMRQNEKKYEVKVDVTDGLIPSMAAGRSAAQLHAALEHTRNTGKKQKEKQKKVIYQDDWQIKAAAQVLGFFSAANYMGHSRRSTSGRPEDVSHSPRERLAGGQVLPTSDFYMTLLDDSDLVADFEAWEWKQGKFSFCQFPFLLSIGAKIKILEYDAKRQMEIKARDAFFESINSHRSIQQYLVLDIRRDCLVDDSLKAVGEVIGSGGEDIKKGLKINFKGEEGVDAGGLRKEWFLLLVREVFNPDHGTSGFLGPPTAWQCWD